MPIKPHPTDPDKMVYVKREYMTAKTPTPLYRQVLPVEDQGKISASRYYAVTPETTNLGMPSSPYYKQCNLRIDFGLDGGIYKVEWQNE